MWPSFSCGDWGLLSGCGAQASRCGGFSVAMCGLSHTAAGRILLDQALNLADEHWQMNSQLLDHQGSPTPGFRDCEQGKKTLSPQRMSYFN